VLLNQGAPLIVSRSFVPKRDDLGPCLLAVALMRERRGLIVSLITQRNQRSHFCCPPCGYPASEQRNCRQQ
jgi:hypothetical protein